MSTPDVVEFEGTVVEGTVVEGTVVEGTVVEGTVVDEDKPPSAAAQRESLTCSASSHGPEMSTPDVVEFEDTVEVDGTDAADDDSCVVDVPGSIDPLPSKTLAPAAALTPMAVKAAVARIIWTCRCTLMVVSNS